MKDLIEALQIFLLYGNPDYPTICTHDDLIIAGIDPAVVIAKHIKRLEELGFRVEDEYGDAYFHSYKYGSA